MLVKDAVALTQANWLKVRRGKPLRMVAWLHEYHRLINYDNYEPAGTNDYVWHLRPCLRLYLRNHIHFHCEPLPACAQGHAA